jgi:hypothetical protein
MADRDGIEWTAEDAAFFAEVVAEDSTGNVQLYGADEDDILQIDTTQKYEPYGYYSRYPAGTEVMCKPKDDEEVAIVGANPSRPTLANAGQVQIRDSEDSFIDLKAAGGGIDIEARSGQSVVTKSPTLLGAAAAIEEIIKGKTAVNDIQVFCAAWQTALTNLITALPPPAPEGVYATAVQTALTALQATFANWLSTKHKIDA